MRSASMRPSNGPRRAPTITAGCAIDRTLDGDVHLGALGEGDLVAHVDDLFFFPLSRWPTRARDRRTGRDRRRDTDDAHPWPGQAVAEEVVERQLAWPGQGENAGGDAEVERKLEAAVHGEEPVGSVHVGGGSHGSSDRRAVRGCR